MGSVLILIKYMCFVVNIVFVVVNVSIVVKIKCANNISDIFNKLNSTINYTHFIKTHTYIKIFETCDETIS